MERGVVIGGILISASFLFAVLLNHSADSPPPISGPDKEAGAQACPDDDQHQASGERSGENPGERAQKPRQEPRRSCRRRHARD